MIPVPISTEYVMHPSKHPVCLYVIPPVVARQRLCKIVISVTITHTTLIRIKEVYLSADARQQICKYVNTRNC
jgi:hypothetical protein